MADIHTIQVYRHWRPKKAAMQSITDDIASIKARQKNNQLSQTDETISSVWKASDRLKGHELRRSARSHARGA
jgi:hypothetical protein